MVGRLWANRPAATSSTAASLRFIPIQRLGNGHAAHIDAAEIGGPHPVLLGEQQGLLAPFRFDRYRTGEMHPKSNSPFPWS